MNKKEESKQKNRSMEKGNTQEEQVNWKTLELAMKQGGSSREQADSSELKLSNETVQQIFDKVFKKLLTLSGRAVISLINGLFDTDYPLDSQITYNWTEFEDEKMKRRLADTILTINGRHSYHLEAQVTNDHRIVFRVFDYGYGHALHNRVRQDDRYVLRFPRPVVIYLYYEGQVPDEYTLTLEFDEGRDFYQYKVPVVKLPELSAEDLNRRKMVILIPFHLLKLKKWLKQGKVTEETLRKLIYDDIIGNINENRQLGNISPEDAMKLKRYTRLLGDYLYAKLQGEGLEVLRDMTDESFMTDVDIFFEGYHAQERALEEKDKALKEQDEALREKDKALKEQDKALKEQDKTLKEQDKTLKEKDETIREKDQTIRAQKNTADRKLVMQVCRNHEKGKSPEAIAEDLIESIDVVQRICDIRNSLGDGCDPEQVLAKYLESA